MENNSFNTISLLINRITLISIKIFADHPFSLHLYLGQTHNKLYLNIQTFMQINIDYD